MSKAFWSPTAIRCQCNYFQRVENDLDETHVHFVHRVSTDSYGLNELPDIDCTETDYGILRVGARQGSGANQTRTAHWMMPNVHFLDLPPSPSHPHWTVYLAYRVPVDDENMVTLSVAIRPVGSNTTGRRETIEPDPAQMTEDVLAGKIRIQDIDPKYPGLFVVQDNVALAGQGRIVDRSRDWLGQSDKGVILLRKLWERELKKIGEGKPLKNWHRPKEKLHLLVDRPKVLAEV